ncbi:alpha-1,2-fucosyltransferase [Haloferula sp.]|uniref:alpha-1,2-fucosyltransferase n=1 Tax=Haloferula sp. TaxID=2497595 RepID=UPI003C794B62
MPVVARIWGGLGNQMFAYAFARALSLRNNDELILDTRLGFEGDPYGRVYCLDKYQIDFPEASSLDTRPGQIGSLTRRLKKAVNRSRDLSTATYVEEPKDPAFMPEIARMDTRSRRVLFKGYWQSPRYFEDFADQIRKDFTVVAPLDENTRRIQEAMSRCDAIGLHARRLHQVHAGQEASGPKAGVKQISLDYYKTAVAKMVEGLANPHLFCFGDAKDWLRENLDFDLPMTIVEGRDGDEWAYQDIHLISQCQRFAIANSSFSWWGAWLSKAPDKQIYYPRPGSWSWFWNRDIIPDGWTSIDC